MNILITGATGYIGKRLIPLLLNEGHTVICAVRDKKRVLNIYKDETNLVIVEVDFLDAETLQNIPKEIDVAYYLIHSMSNASKDFEVLEERCARNFKDYIETTNAKHVIYLSGITNDDKLSKLLKLEESSTEIFSTLDEYGKLKIFETSSEIVEYFVNFRLTYYHKRKKFMLDKMQHELKILSNFTKKNKYKALLLLVGLFY